MAPRTAFIGLLCINALLVVGDLLAKRAVADPTRSVPLTTGALLIWITACCMWLPVMRARGFTRLVALSDVIGLLMLSVVGYFFLNERLNSREVVGVVLAVASVICLA